MNETLRAPSVPLITVDPFFSVWSFADHLTDDVTRHWTGLENSLLGLIRVDGQPYRFMGLEYANPNGRFGELTPMRQTNLQISATQTTYQFEAAGIGLEVRFIAPLLLDDLMIASRPLNYLSLTVYSNDGLPHAVDLYLDLGGSLCADRIERAAIAGELSDLAGMTGIRLWNNAPDSQILASSGDDQRINWGSVHLLPLPATPENAGCQTAIGSVMLRQAFVETGVADPAVDTALQARFQGEYPVIGAVSCRMYPRPSAGRCQADFILAYDDQCSINYFGRQTPAYCFKDGLTFAGIIELAARDYTDLYQRCQTFDQWLAARSEHAGGAAYAAITALAYRQAIAAHKLIADADGQPVFLSKECFSNGCIGTVDVSYPSTPLFLLLCPELVRGMLRPVFRFAASAAWPYDFAPHDVGQYPLATGQVYGLKDGQFRLESQMPVEECGNMLIMTAAACRTNGDFTLAQANLGLLGQWAGYLQKYGQDPGDQLCTDDFAGHLNHNANLSIKAIIGLGAWALILKACREPAQAADVLAQARLMADKWLEMAADGDRTKLTFDRAGTWSMKYNLLFDRVLDLNLFPESLYASEINAYLQLQNRYGLPLDSRASYTKADWLVWCAALADDPVQVQALIEPLYRYYNETGSRVPLTDWYDTVSGRYIHFRNRSVIGGLFALLLPRKPFRSSAADTAADRLRD